MVEIQLVSSRQFFARRDSNAYSVPDSNSATTQISNSRTSQTRPIPTSINAPVQHCQIFRSTITGALGQEGKIRSGIVITTLNFFRMCRCTAVASTSEIEYCGTE